MHNTHIPYKKHKYLIICIIYTSIVIICLKWNICLHQNQIQSNPIFHLWLILNWWLFVHECSLFADHTVTQLKFVVREDADTLVVAVNGDAGALIEIWELQEKPLTVHKLFQSKVQSAEPLRTVVFLSLSYLYLITFTKNVITTFVLWNFYSFLDFVCRLRNKHNIFEIITTQNGQEENNTSCIIISVSKCWKL